MTGSDDTAADLADLQLAYEAHVAHLDAELAARDQRLADLEANRDAVQANLDAVQNSKTMRALRPVRGAYRWVRQRARA